MENTEKELPNVTSFETLQRLTVHWFDGVSNREVHFPLTKRDQSAWPTEGPPNAYGHQYSSIDVAEIDGRKFYSEPYDFSQPEFHGREVSADALHLYMPDAHAQLPRLKEEGYVRFCLTAFGLVVPLQADAIVREAQTILTLDQFAPPIQGGPQ